MMSSVALMVSTMAGVNVYELIMSAWKWRTHNFLAGEINVRALMSNWATKKWLPNVMAALPEKVTLFDIIEPPSRTYIELLSMKLHPYRNKWWLPNALIPQEIKTVWASRLNPSKVILTMLLMLWAYNLLRRVKVVKEVPSVNHHPAMIYLLPKLKALALFTSRVPEMLLTLKSTALKMMKEDSYLISLKLTPEEQCTIIMEACTMAMIPTDGELSMMKMLDNHQGRLWTMFKYVRKGVTRLIDPFGWFSLPK